MNGGVWTRGMTRAIERSTKCWHKNEGETTDYIPISKRMCLPL